MLHRTHRAVALRRSPSATSSRFGTRKQPSSRRPMIHGRVTVNQRSAQTLLVHHAKHPTEITRRVSTVPEAREHSPPSRYDRRCSHGPIGQAIDLKRIRRHAGPVLGSAKCIAGPVLMDRGPNIVGVLGDRVPDRGSAPPNRPALSSHKTSRATFLLGRSWLKPLKPRIPPTPCRANLLRQRKTLTIRC